MAQTALCFISSMKKLILSIWSSEGLQSVCLRPIHTTTRCLCNVSPNRFISSSYDYLSATMLLLTFSHNKGLLKAVCIWSQTVTQNFRYYTKWW